MRPVAEEEECGELSGVSFGRGNGPGESLADEKVTGLEPSLYMYLHRELLTMFNLPSFRDIRSQETMHVVDLLITPCPAFDGFSI